MASIEGFQQQVKQDRWIRNLEDDMKLLIPFIEDKRITDIAIGTGGEVIVEGIGMIPAFLHAVKRVYPSIRYQCS